MSVFIYNKPILINRLIKGCWSFAILLLLNACGAQYQTVNQNSPCELTMGWSDWPPYMEASAGKPTGFQIELVEWVAQELKCRVRYQQYSWNDNLKAIETGKVDFIGRASKTSERESFAWFSAPYRQDMLALTGRRGEAERFTGNKLESFLEQGFVVGLLQGGYFGKEVEALRSSTQYKTNFKIFKLETDIYAAINRKEIDGILEAPFTIEKLQSLKNNNYHFEQFSLDLVIDDLHFMFSKKTVSADFVTAFNRALTNVKKSSEYQNHWFWMMVQ